MFLSEKYFNPLVKVFEKINGLMDKKRAAMPIFYAEAVYKQLGMLRILQLSN